MRGCVLHGGKCACVSNLSAVNQVVHGISALACDAIS
jgi:hypothetical protein